MLLPVAVGAAVLFLDEVTDIISGIDHILAGQVSYMKGSSHCQNILRYFSDPFWHSDSTDPMGTCHLFLVKWAALKVKHET